MPSIKRYGGRISRQKSRIAKSRSGKSRSGKSRIAAARLLALLVMLGLMRAQSPPPGAPNQPPPAQPPASRQPSPTPVKRLVMIDPAHGGSESGAVLNPTLLEKDVTLTLARRLRQDLSARGIPGELVRDGDSTLSTDDRAARANSERPALYICLHASSLVGSTRVVTAMLAEEEEQEQEADSRGPFLDWETAQSGLLRSSAAVQQQLVASFADNGLRARALRARLRPLNNVAVPAVAIEIAPTAADVSQLVAPDFDKAISNALVSGIARLVSSLSSGSGAPQP